MYRQNFNQNWRVGKKGRFFGMEAAEASAAVTLPHDAMIANPRTPDAAAGNKKGFWPDGVYEYTKVFDVPEEWADQRVYLEFEGVYRDAEVLINGDCACNYAYGYTGFVIRADRYLEYGKTNKLNVTVRSADDSRWYSGTGIYRPVHLYVGPLVHLPPSAVKVATPEVADDRAVVETETLVRNDSHRRITVTVQTELLNAEGQAVTVDTAPMTLFAGEEATLRRRILLEHPRLWSTESPALYTCRTTLFQRNVELDQCTEPFGVRTLSLDVKHGFCLNGESIKLRGACVHHDNGPLGAATFTSAEYRRIQRLKRAGFNSIRMAHHPASTALLDACDQLGMLVMDEAFDMWGISKSDFDYGNRFEDFWDRDVTAMVRKDYNHPSVVFYSIGNEIPDTGSPVGSTWGRKLAERVRSLDASRYTINCINGVLCVLDEVKALMQSGADSDINQAMNDAGDSMNRISAMPRIGEVTAESFAYVDVAGYNYMDSRYAIDREQFPNRVICGSETFPRFIGRNWQLILESPHVIGDYTWTGWDYLGEAGIGKVSYGDENSVYSGWPWLAAWCGDIDLIGQRRPASYYREIVFGLRKEPYIAVQRPQYYGKEARLSPWSWSDCVSGWSWDGFEGQSVIVEVYADADEVALLYNGQELRRTECGIHEPYKAVFDTVYTPGELTAVAYKNGVELSRHGLRTAVGEARLQIVWEDVAPHPGERLVFLRLELCGENGALIHNSPIDVTLSVEGPAELIAFGSADPVSDQNFYDTTRTTYNGQLLAILRPSGEGEVLVAATAEGCAPAQITIV